MMIFVKPYGVRIVSLLIFDLMSSRNMYLYNAYIYTYILL